MGSCGLEGKIRADQRVEFSGAASTCCDSWWIGGFRGIDLYGSGSGGGEVRMRAAVA
jgi:hypothetical protein